MLKKFNIEYMLFPEHNDRVLAYRSDDAVETEDFLAHLIASGARIKSIRHNEVELSRAQSDHMLKIAAEQVVATLLERSLGLDSAAIRNRFGFAA